MASKSNMTLRIEPELKEQAAASAEELLKTRGALDVINEYMIPALDRVGKGFEAGTVFLPQPVNHIQPGFDLLQLVGGLA